ncbi:LuxR C-terminal-related transcriptional regulator [Microbacterium sp. NPDC058342]|uniref:LuxR C-terminal-related transcriptional regulator n=1 Tax=Microbacterium sp. NPDC058342 TaxID=3346454 RepID=UPI0036558255
MTQHTDRRHVDPRAAARRHEGREHHASRDPGGAGRARERAIGVPRVSSRLIPRERLIARLDAEPAPALTVVQAGSGFGKTSLLADWARTRPDHEPLVWVTADETVRDSVGFWREVLHGIDRTGLLAGSELSRVEVRGDIADTLTASLRRGFASLLTPVTLVVDGFERLDGTGIESELIDILTRTDGLRLVVATQVPSELGSVATASRLDTLHLDAATLRFTDQEIRELAARLGVAASQRELHELRAHLDGWPFGVRAVLERHLREESATIADARHAVFGVPTRQPTSMDPSYVSSHLLESLRGLDGLELVTVTSVLDAFTLEQATVLGAALESHPVLDELESRGLGTWHLDTDPPEYRLHPVLRRALRERLDDDRTRAAFTRLARWHVSRREFAPAFEAAVRAGQWALAGRCVRSDLFEVLVRLRLHPDLLEAVPRSVLRQEPLLMLVSGVAHYGAGHHAKAVRMLLAAVAACERQRVVGRRASTPDQVWVQGILTIALRLAGRYEMVPVALRRFSRMLEAVDDPAGHLDPAMLLFRTQTVITLSFMDRLDAAEHLALDTVRERHPMSPLQQANLQGLTAFTHARRGDPARAAEVLRGMDQVGRPAQFDDSFFAVTAHVAAAWTALERFDARAAEHVLKHSDRHWPTMEYWPFVLEARTHADWQLRGPESALLTLREGRAEKRFKAPIGDALVLLLVALEAELLLAAGLGAEAASLLTSSRLRRSVRLEVPRSRSLLLSGNWDQAAGIAERNALGEAQPWHNRIDLLLISASANLRAGDREAAQRRFDQGAAIAERTGTLTPFASMPRADLIELGYRRPALLDQIPGEASRYPEPAVAVALTRREHHVLAALASDRTLPEIAQMLSVSTNTLKSQLRSVYRKLEVGGRQEAVQVARRTGLLLRSREVRTDDGET